MHPSFRPALQYSGFVPPWNWSWNNRRMPAEFYFQSTEEYAGLIQYIMGQSVACKSTRAVKLDALLKIGFAYREICDAAYEEPDSPAPPNDLDFRQDEKVWLYIVAMSKEVASLVSAEVCNPFPYLMLVADTFYE